MPNGNGSGGSIGGSADATSDPSGLGSSADGDQGSTPPGLGDAHTSGGPTTSVARGRVPNLSGEQVTAVARGSDSACPAIEAPALSSAVGTPPQPVAAPSNSMPQLASSGLSPQQQAQLLQLQHFLHHQTQLQLVGAASLSAVARRPLHSSTVTAPGGGASCACPSLPPASSQRQQEKVAVKDSGGPPSQAAVVGAPADQRAMHPPRGAATAPAARARGKQQSAGPDKLARKRTRAASGGGGCDGGDTSPCGGTTSSRSCRARVLHPEPHGLSGDSEEPEGCSEVSEGPGAAGTEEGQQGAGGAGGTAAPTGDLLWISRLCEHEESMPGCHRCRFAKTGCDSCHASPLVRRPGARWRPDKARFQEDITAAPVFHPTPEEFADPLAYIATIRSEAERFGICAVVPPPHPCWDPPPALPLPTGNRSFNTSSDGACGSGTCCSLYPESFRFAPSRQVTTQLCMRPPTSATLAELERRGTAGAQQQQRRRPQSTRPCELEPGGRMGRTSTSSTDSLTRTQVVPGAAPEGLERPHSADPVTAVGLPEGGSAVVAEAGSTPNAPPGAGAAGGWWASGSSISSSGGAVRLVAPGPGPGSSPRRPGAAVEGSLERYVTSLRAHPLLGLDEEAAAEAAAALSTAEPGAHNGAGDRRRSDVSGSGSGRGSGRGTTGGGGSDRNRSGSGDGRCSKGAVAAGRTPRTGRRTPRRGPGAHLGRVARFLAEAGSQVLAHAATGAGRQEASEASGLTSEGGGDAGGRRDGGGGSGAANAPTPDKLHTLSSFRAYAQWARSLHFNLPPFGDQLCQGEPLLGVRSGTGQLQDALGAGSTGKAASSPCGPSAPHWGAPLPPRVRAAVKHAAAGDAPTIEEVEAEFWRLVERPEYGEEVEALYGEDLDPTRHDSELPLGHGSASVPTQAEALAQAQVPRQASESAQSQAQEREREEERERKQERRLAGDEAAVAAAWPDERWQRYGSHPWNPRNVARAAGSLLRYLEAGEVAPGVLEPRLEVGSCLSASCWRQEQLSLYSVCYLHCGEAKIWYGVPSSASRQFEEAMLQAAVPDPSSNEEQPQLLRRRGAMLHISPSELRSRGVPVCRLVQEPGSFVVVFPGAHRSHLDCGFSVAETASFAPPDWLPHGAAAAAKDRLLGRRSALCMEGLLVRLLLDAAASRGHRAEIRGRDATARQPQAARSAGLGDFGQAGAVGTLPYGCEDQVKRPKGCPRAAGCAAAGDLAVGSGGEAKFKEEEEADEDARGRDVVQVCGRLFSREQLRVLIDSALDLLPEAGEAVAAARQRGAPPPAAVPAGMPPVAPRGLPLLHSCEDEPKDFRCDVSGPQAVAAVIRESCAPPGAEVARAASASGQQAQAKPTGAAAAPRPALPGYAEVAAGPGLVVLTGERPGTSQEGVLEGQQAEAERRQDQRRPAESVGRAGVQRSARRKAAAAPAAVGLLLPPPQPLEAAVLSAAASSSPSSPPLLVMQTDLPVLEPAPAATEFASGQAMQPDPVLAVDTAVTMPTDSAMAMPPSPPLLLLVTPSASSAAAPAGPPAAPGGKKRPASHGAAQGPAAAAALAVVPAALAVAPAADRAVRPRRERRVPRRLMDVDMELAEEMQQVVAGAGAAVQSQAPAARPTSSSEGAGPQGSVASASAAPSGAGGASCADAGEESGPPVVDREAASLATAGGEGARQPPPLPSSSSCSQQLPHQERVLAHELQPHEQPRQHQPHQQDALVQQRPLHLSLDAGLAARASGPSVETGGTVSGVLTLGGGLNAGALPRSITNQAEHAAPPPPPFAPPQRQGQGQGHHDDVAKAERSQTQQAQGRLGLQQGRLQQGAPAARQQPASSASTAPVTPPTVTPTAPASPAPAALPSPPPPPPPNPESAAVALRRSGRATRPSVRLTDVTAAGHGTSAAGACGAGGGAPVLLLKRMTTAGPSTGIRSGSAAAHRLPPSTGTQMPPPPRPPPLPSGLPPTTAAATALGCCAVAAAASAPVECGGTSAVVDMAVVAAALPPGAAAAKAVARSPPQAAQAGPPGGSGRLKQHGSLGEVEVACAASPPQLQARATAPAKPAHSAPAAFLDVVKQDAPCTALPRADVATAPEVAQAQQQPSAKPLLLELQQQQQPFACSRSPLQPPPLPDDTPAPSSSAPSSSAPAPELETAITSAHQQEPLPLPSPQQGPQQVQGQEGLRESEPPATSATGRPARKRRTTLSTDMVVYGESAALFRPHAAAAPPTKRKAAAAAARRPAVCNGATPAPATTTTAVTTTACPPSRSTAPDLPPGAASGAEGARGDDAAVRVLGGGDLNREADTLVGLTDELGALTAGMPPHRGLFADLHRDRSSSPLPPLPLPLPPVPPATTPLSRLAPLAMHVSLHGCTPAGSSYGTTTPGAPVPSGGAGGPAIPTFAEAAGGVMPGGNGIADLAMTPPHVPPHSPGLLDLPEHDHHRHHHDPEDHDEDAFLTDGSDRTLGMFASPSADSLESLALLHLETTTVTNTNTSTATATATAPAAAAGSNGGDSPQVVLRDACGTAEAPGMAGGRDGQAGAAMAAMLMRGVALGGRGQAGPEAGRETTADVILEVEMEGWVGSGGAAHSAAAPMEARTTAAAAAAVETAADHWMLEAEGSALNPDENACLGRAPGAQVWPCEAEGMAEGMAEGAVAGTQGQARLGESRLWLSCLTASAAGEWAELEDLVVL